MEERKITKVAEATREQIEAARRLLAKHNLQAEGLLAPNTRRTRRPQGASARRINFGARN